MVRNLRNLITLHFSYGNFISTHLCTQVHISTHSLVLFVSKAKQYIFESRCFEVSSIQVSLNQVSLRSGDKAVYEFSRKSKARHWVMVSDQVWCIWSGFWVIPKIISAYLCRPIHDIINYFTSSCPFESGKCGKEGKKNTIVFERLSFSEKIKIC